MNRNSQHLATILRIAPFGDTHAVVDLLVPERGVLSCVAYGLRSRRSSLRGRLMPFARGTAYLYTDPRREMPKIVDFDGTRYVTAVQGNLAAYYHGTLWAEVVWRTLASGDGGDGGDGGDAVTELIANALDLLDETVAAGETGGFSREERAFGPDSSAVARPVPHAVTDVQSRIQLLSTIVLWRYLAILGMQPDLVIRDGASSEQVAEEVRFYDRQESSFVAQPRHHTLQLPPGAARLLAASDQYPLVRAAQLPVTAATLAAARSFVFAVIQDAVEVPLNTLRVAAGSF